MRDEGETLVSTASPADVVTHWREGATISVLSLLSMAFQQSIQHALMLEKEALREKIHDQPKLEKFHDQYARYMRDVRVRLEMLRPWLDAVFSKTGELVSIIGKFDRIMEKLYQGDPGKAFKLFPKVLAKHRAQLLVVKESVERELKQYEEPVAQEVDDRQHTQQEALA